MKRLTLALAVTASLTAGACLQKDTTSTIYLRRDGSFDWVVLAVLGVQLITGVQIAIAHTWGSAWFASAAAPYLWSLLFLKPDLTAVAAFPLAVKLHIVNAYGLILLGYHAMAGTPGAILEHSMSSKSIQNYWINGRLAGEVAIDAAPEVAIQEGRIMRSSMGPYGSFRTT